MQKKINIPWPVIVCSLFVFLFTNLFSLFIFDHIPRVHDEIDYVFQARILKSGKFYVASPCGKESFDFPHMVNNGKWYSQYPPGYPFLLLFGLFIKAPWLINPILAAFSVILFYFLGKEIYDLKVGILAAVLGSLSIWFLVMSSTMMSHTSSLFFYSFFLLFIFRSIKKPSTANGLFAGLGLGMAFLIRPYNTVLLSLPFLLYYAIQSLKDFKKSKKNIGALALTTLVFISVILIYNQITNGHPLRMGYVASYGDDHSVGFGRTGYTDIPHTPYLGSTKIGSSLSSLNKYLFGWPLSSFLALLPLLWMSKINKEYRKKDILLVAGFFTLMAGLFFYWGTHVFIGPRLFFDALPILFLLSAHGITEAPRLFSLKFKKFNPLRVKKATVGALIFLTAYAFIIRFPNWVWPPNTDWYYDGFANNFAGVTPKIHNTISSLQLDRSLVITKLLYHPFEYFPDGWWSTGFLYDDPYLKESIIYANDKGENNIKLFQCFPERKIYLYIGTLEKGMLVPLIKEGKKIIFEEPLSLNKPEKKCIELVTDPMELYVIYSEDFEIFLDNLYKQNHFSKIDISRLIELGLLSKNNRDYQEASYYFEAALQIEKQPEIKLRVLNQLAACYLKTGNIDEAKIITDRIKYYDDAKLLKVLPEKGF